MIQHTDPAARSASSRFDVANERLVHTGQRAEGRHGPNVATCRTPGTSHCAESRAPRPAGSRPRSSASAPRRGPWRGRRGGGRGPSAGPRRSRSDVRENRCDPSALATRALLDGRKEILVGIHGVDLSTRRHRSHEPEREVSRAAAEVRDLLSRLQPQRCHDSIGLLLTIPARTDDRDRLEPAAQTGEHRAKRAPSERALPRARTPTRSASPRRRRECR